MTKDNGKYNYKGKTYNIITCWCDSLHIPIISKYQMVKEDGTIYKELHPHQAETMLAKGELTKYQSLSKS
jgi:hypothetical protein